MKLSPLESHRLRTAHTEASAVLRSLKARTLKGKELEDMKILEDATAALEVLLATVRTA